MSRSIGALLLLASASCAWTPLYRQGVGHPTFGDGVEYHACSPEQGGGACREGYACVRGGCEWCDDDDLTDTRCTTGHD